MDYRTNIQVPELKDEDIITIYSQLRPSREGGIRIEREVRDGKTIVHDYGHSGAGITLSPSTSLEAVGLALDLLRPKSEIAIIGSGIVGMLTAYHILQKQPTCKITLYAEEVPTFCCKNNKHVITTEVAPGFWLPYNYGCTDQKMHLRQCRYAYDWYKSISEKEKYKSYVKETDFYDFSDDCQEGDLIKELTEQLKPSLRQCYVTLNNKTKVKCQAFKTLKIDLQPFLTIFMSELRDKGVKFVSKKATPENLKEFKEELIFNCSGLGSRELFGDLKIKGTKGHLIEYKNLNPSKYDYFMKANVGGKAMIYFMHDSRILIGRTLEKEQHRQIVPQVVQEMKQIHKIILEKFNLKEVNAKL